MSGAEYIELHAHSAYSFLDGASLPEELAVRAAELGYPALALTDHDGVYGSLEFAYAARAVGVRAITGAEATLADGSHLTLLVETPRGYANLCRLLTAAHGRERLNPGLEPDLLAELNEGLVCLSGCARQGLGVKSPNTAARLAEAFGRDRFYVELQRPYARGDARRNAALRDLAGALEVRTIATGDVHAHHPRRARLQDVLVAVKHNVALEGCEAERRGNDQFVLTPPAEAAARFPEDRDAVRATVELAERLEFDLTHELGYRYPDFSDGADPADVQLAQVCGRAFEERYRNAPAGLRTRASARLREELALIAELGLSGFFLLHWEVLELAREVAYEVRGHGSPRHLLPPGRGRGSSVGSIVCYLTGLSHVDPVSAGLALGRFLNRELVSVPDIDLDFPRDIREKLIVAVIERYGHEHSALVASFATYRSRGAIRDVGKALGLPQSELERLARITEGSPRRVAEEMEKLPGAESKLASPRWRAFGELCAEIGGLPRHLSQHPGGMVISSRPLVELVPVEHAAMEGRRLCQWDKDSCADAGFLKIDLLGLGMLSAVEECVDQIVRLRGERIDLSRIPLDDPVVYREIQDADTVGLFQIESRAQMQSLLRTRPGEPRRPHRAGGTRPSGPDPGKSRASLRRAEAAPARGPVLCHPARPSTPRRVPRGDARRDHLPGAGARGRDGARGVQRGGGRGAAPGDEPQAEPGRDRGPPRALLRGSGEKRRARGDHGARLFEDQRLRSVRLPQVARGRLRAPRLPVRVAPPLLPRRVPLRAPERPADGLLSAGEPRAGRAAPRGRGAAARREPERRFVPHRRQCSANRARLHQGPRRAAREGVRGRAGGERWLHERHPARAACSARPARARGFGGFWSM